MDTCYAFKVLSEYWKKHLAFCFSKIETNNVATIIFWISKEYISDDPLVFRFTHLLFGFLISTFLLAVTIKHHVQKFDLVYSARVICLNENVYMDDIVGRHLSLDDALSVRLLSTYDIFKKANKQLHKWHLFN